MKNDSHLFPVETPMDSLFDSNKDGKLTGFETTMRDAALYDSEKCFHESKAEKEKQKKYTKIALILISICIAIGLIAFLGFDLSYRAAINEAIESEHAWSFHFDVDKHPNYKDAQGWELYCKAKMYSVKEYKEDFLKYEFKHTNAKQDKAIQELKNKINGVNNTNENNYYDTDNLHELVGTWYCPAYQSCNGGSITITIKQKGNTLYFNRDMIMSTSVASSNIDYEVSLPVNDSFRVDDIHCTYVFDGSTLKEEFDNDRENVFERVFEDSSTSDTTTSYYNGATEYSHYTTTKHYTTKHHTTKRYTENDDPYNAKDYGNEDDFYEDHYDDFFDYYDAEDYYMEHYDD